MANVAFDSPFRTAPPARRRLFRLLVARLRLLRRAQARRRLLALVLAETRDPRLLEDIGFRPPGPSMLELWAQATLRHRR